MLTNSINFLVYKYLYIRYEFILVLNLEYSSQFIATNESKRSNIMSSVGHYSRNKKLYKDKKKRFIH